MESGSRGSSTDRKYLRLNLQGVRKEEPDYGFFDLLRQERSNYPSSDAHSIEEGRATVGLLFAKVVLLTIAFHCKELEFQKVRCIDQGSISSGKGAFTHGYRLRTRSLPTERTHCEYRRALGPLDEWLMQIPFKNGIRHLVKNRRKTFYFWTTPVVYIAIEISRFVLVDGRLFLLLSSFFTLVELYRENVQFFSRLPPYKTYQDRMNKVCNGLIRTLLNSAPLLEALFFGEAAHMFKKETKNKEAVFRTKAHPLGGPFCNGIPEAGPFNPFFPLLQQGVTLEGRFRFQRAPGTYLGTERRWQIGYRNHAFFSHLRFQLLWPDSRLVSALAVGTQGFRFES
ncbi:hypothetical protein CDAR_515941 [Caerostris darwini]|uniref:Uncharacterized protein n=1 Tax=Caerostris darwini TaxID=1538125 RepID=A0AAV4NGJ9_9ARAC|nr:hypothetical protein CDAR_515941 [Caerostris darwini]